MAYSVKGLAIINDSRELLGVNTAGINTALYVGDVKIQDGVIEAQTGVVTFVGDGRSLTGIVTVSDSGGTPEFEGNLNVNGTLDVSGHIEGDSLNISGISTLNSLQFADAVSVSGISEDLDVSAAATQLVTAQGTKSYVDAKIGGGAVLEISGDEGVEGSVDLAANEVFQLEGTANQIVSDINGTAGLNTVTFKLSSELVAPGSLQVTGLSTFVGNVELATGVSLVFADDGNTITGVGVATDLGDTTPSDSIIPTQKAVKEYVDGVSEAVEANAQLRLNADGTQFGQIELSTENLGFDAGSNMVITGAGNTYTVALASDVVLTGNLQAGILTATGNAFVGGDLEVTGTFGFDGGQTVDAISTATDLDDASASDSTLPTQLAVKTYVDAKVGGNTNAESIDVADNQDAVAYSVPFVSATGAGVSMYSDAAQLTYNPSTGLLVAQDFNSLSDIRFKENVETIVDATAKLGQIRGVEFDWKNVEGSSVGVIAQEVQALYPQLVTQGEEKLTVNYNGLTGLLIEAVKELTARVAELEGKA